LLEQENRDVDRAIRESEQERDVIQVSFIGTDVMSSVCSPVSVRFGTCVLRNAVAELGNDTYVRALLPIYGIITRSAMSLAFCLFMLLLQ
jgi:hypothetical protein